MSIIHYRGIDYGDGGGGSSWVTDIPEMHRNIYRGEAIGTSVTADQLASIVDGSFVDMYIGDYWEIPVTIDGTTKTIKWRIADIDYFIGYRDAVDTTKRMTTHHLVIVPDTALYATTPGYRSNGYNGSDVRTSGLSKAKTAINTIFPNMVLEHKDYLSTSVDGNGNVSKTEEKTCTIELMNEVMVFGFNRFQLPANQQGYVYYSHGGQFALFSLCPKWKSHNAEEPVVPTTGVVSYLLQDPCYTSYQNFWTGAWTLEIGPLNYTNNGGVRPYFIIGSR